MEDLVLIKNNKAVCDSLIVADKFKKRHDNVVRDIRNLLKNEEIKNRKLFIQSEYTDTKGRAYEKYLMNRKGFTILAMGFNGDEALHWKLLYSDAFDKMEEILKERSSKLWIDTRIANKETRLKETDVIKQLTDYAKDQGSTHSDRLYVVYTKLAKSVTGGKRDNVSVSELNNLTLVESIILQTIQIDMSMQMHYKEIYKDCKNRIEQFMNIAYLTA